METIQVIYASTSGNVEKVVETVAEVLQSEGFPAELHRAEQTELSLIQSNATFILATSTWEHGRLNPFFEKLAESMKNQDFSGKRAAFIGLGDRRYEPVLFTEGMEKLRKIWLDQGGQEIGDRMRLQGEPYDKLENVVKPWARSFVQALRPTQESHD